MSNGNILEGFGDDFTVYQDTVSTRLDTSLNKLGGGTPVDTPVDTSSAENNWVEDYIRGQIDRKIPLVGKDSIADYLLKLPDYADLAAYKIYSNIDKEKLIAFDKLMTKSVSYGVGSSVDIPLALLSLLGIETSEKAFPVSRYISKKLDVEQYLPEENVGSGGGAG